MSLPPLPDFGTIVEPITHKSIQAGGVWTSYVDRNLLYQTEGLHRVGLLSRRSYAWPFPEGAPLIDTANVTATVFEMPDFGDSVNMEIPWYSHDGVTHIGAEVYVAIYDKYTRLQMRLNAETLVTAISTANGAYVEAVPNFGTTGLWNREGRFVSVAKVSLVVKPNYPADRRIALTLTGIWNVFDADGSPFSNTRKAKIVSMKIFDINPISKRS